MIKKILMEVLQNCLDKLDAGTCNMSDEEMLKAIEIINSSNTDRGMSKELACRYLNMSRSTFDTYIRNGWIPKGEKVLGFKELQWSKTLLDLALEKIKEGETLFFLNTHKQRSAE